MKSWRVFGFDYSPQEVMEAHQFLYYCGGHPGCEGLAQVWSDYEYDKWCESQGLDGSGGDDRASAYSQKVRALAIAMHKEPSRFQPERFQ